MGACDIKEVYTFSARRLSSYWMENLAKRSLNYSCIGTGVGRLELGVFMSFVLRTKLEPNGFKEFLPKKSESIDT